MVCLCRHFEPEISILWHKIDISASKWRHIYTIFGKFRGSGQGLDSGGQSVIEDCTRTEYYHSLDRQKFWSHTSQQSVENGNHLEISFFGAFSGPAEISILGRPMVDVC